MADRDLSRDKDPSAEKRRDTAHQRKIASNSSDKAARRNAPLIKARANRAVRHQDRIDLAAAPADDQGDADSLKATLKTRRRTWGSNNAAEQRAVRDQERAFLDATAGQAPPGRNRTSQMPKYPARDIKEP